MLIVPAIFFLSGCLVGPDYQPPEVETSGAFLNATGGDESPAESWRALFESPALNALIERAEANNHNLLAAWQSVVASRAAIQRFRADGLPDISAGARLDVFDNSDAVAQVGQGISGERYEADIFAAWEIDLFGRIRRSVRAAAANAEVEEALYRDLILTMQADVAQHFFQILALQSEIELLVRGQETRRESLDLIRQRRAAGTVSELAVAQAKTLLANAEARLYSAQRFQNSLLYSLAILVGETPANFQFEPMALVGAPPAVPAGLPSELLARRPDVRAAERSLAVASEEIGIAQAAFFPRISLSGLFGYASRDWDDLFKPAAYLESFGPSVDVPLLTSGRLGAEKRRAVAFFEQRLELYQQTMIEAIGEAEDSLQSVRLLAAETEALQRSAASAQQAREIAMKQYQQGLSDFITALDAERTALDQEQQLVQAKRSQYVATINLIRALGGAW